MKHNQNSIINDEKRLREIDSLKLGVDFSRREYDAITELASFICKTPVALVSIVKTSGQYFVSHHGFEKEETPLEESICATAIQHKDRVFISKDARIDERIKDNLSVTGENNIVFYAGVPLITKSGHALGTLCVIDHKPRKLNQAQLDALQNLANQVLQLFELRKTQLLLQKSKAELSDESERLKSIIEATRVGTWEWNVKTGEVDLNDRYLKMLGYTRAELEPINIDTWYRLVHPDDKEYSDLKIQECFDKKSQFYNIDCRLVHKNGHEVWVNDRGRVVEWDSDGEPLIMRGTHTDITEKITARLALKQSEEKYKYLFEHNPAPMFIWDFETKDIIDCNTAASLLYGYTRSEFLNLSVRDIRPKEDIARIEDVSRNEDFYSNYNKNMHNDLWRHLKKSGELMHVRIKAHLLNYQGRRASLVIINDETDARDSELALLKSEQKLKTAASIAKLGYWDLNLDTNKLNWSDEVYEIWELSPEKVQPDYDLFASTIHPEDLDRFESQQEKSLKGEQELNVYHRILTPNKKVKWVHEQGRLMRDKQGKPVLFEGTVQDVTEQKLEEQRLYLLNSVVTNTNDSVVIAEAEIEDGVLPKIIYVNEAFTEMTGYTFEEVVGKSGDILHGPKTDKSELKRLKAAMKRWEPCEITTVNYKKNGQEFWVNFKISPVANDMGWYTHWVSLERDVTERKNREIQRELLGELGQLFNNHPNLKPCLDDVLKKLCGFADFDLAEVWLANKKQLDIKMAARYGSTKAAHIFYEESSSMTRFKKGEGLPGMVWKQGKTLVWDRIDKRKAFVRREAAGKSKMKSALGLPLTYNSELLGVLVLGTSNAANALGFYRELFQSFESTLGTEIQRKQFEEQLYNIYDAAPEVICVADQDGYFTKVNPAMSTLLGYTEEELLHTPILDFVHPEDKARTIRAFEGEGLIGDIAKIENRYITKSGQTIWLSWTSKSVENGKIAYCIAKDITEQKELKRLLDEATNLSRVGGWELDLNSGMHYWSEMTREIHEVPRNYQINMERTIAFYRDDYRATAKRAFTRALESGESFDFEAMIVTAKGHERWVRAIGKAELMKGKPVRVYGSFQDIHQRKTIELRLQNTVNNIPGAIFQYKLNPDGTNEMDFVSKGAKFIWGLDADALMEDSSKAWKQVFQSDMAQIESSIAESASSLSKWTNQWRLRNLDGSTKWVEGHGTPRKIRDGSIIWDTAIFDITENKKLEHLVESALRMAKIGSWEVMLTNGENEFIYCDDTTCAILETEVGYKPRFNQGFNVYTEAHKYLIEKAVSMLIENGTPYDLEVQILTRKGNLKWVRCMGQGEFDMGKCTRIFGSIQDIHSMKTAELALRDAYKERNVILESIGDGFFAVDRTWNVTYWNYQAHDILGVSPDEILGENIWNFFDETDFEKNYTKLLEVMKSQRSQRFEIFDSNLSKWFEISAYPSVDGLSVYFRDVTLQKDAQEQVRLSNERFTKASMATNDAVWDWNIQEETLFMGAGFNKLFGYKSDFTKEQANSWSSHLHPEDAHRVIESLEAAVEDPKTTKWTEEYRYQKTDGTYAFIIDRGLVIRDQNKRAVRMVGAMTDITSRRKNEEALSRLNEQLENHAKELATSNAELEQFAYVASHDLQEPLRMVSSFLTQLDKKYGDALDHKAHQYIEFAVEGAARMRQIILDLLDFSRIGKQDSEAEFVNLNELLVEVGRMQRSLIGEKKAEVVFSNLPEIKGFRTPLLQVFQNLVGNALKYSSPDRTPKIEIKHKEQTDNWVITVSDNGIGIEDEYFDKIFVIFQRLHARGDYGGGTGMGLAIVKKIIESMNGEISVESTPDIGTSFYLTIPKH